MPTQNRVVCSVCGATAQDEPFCEDCGALLPVTPPADGAQPQPAGDPGTKAGAGTEPVVQAGTGQGASPAGAVWAGAPGTVTAGSADAGDQPAPTSEPGRPAPGAGPAAADTAPAGAQPDAAADPAATQADPQERARPLLIPVADPVNVVRPERAAPVLPGRPEPARPDVRGPDVDEVTTGIPCPWCSVLNPSDRHYCRKCAMSLAHGPTPTHRPWWRRLLDLRHRPIPFAGQRPRLRTGPWRLVRWLALAVVVGLVIFAVETWGGPGTTNVRDHFDHAHQIVVSSVTATSSDPRHPASKLHDSYNNTWWGTGITGNGAGVSITATFQQPINLLDVIITSGAGVDENTFSSESRPHQIKVTLIPTDGHSSSTVISLADSTGPQTFAIHGDDILHVRFTIENDYEAPSANAEVAVAELEFFARN